MKRDGDGMRRCWIKMDKDEGGSWRLVRAPVPVSWVQDRLVWYLGPLGIHSVEAMQRD
jgi:hypothetical protein